MVRADKTTGRVIQANGHTLLERTGQTAGMLANEEDKDNVGNLKTQGNETQVDHIRTEQQVKTIAEQGTGDRFQK